MGGILHFFGLLSGHRHNKRKKHLRTVDLKVRIDCDGCELKVKKALNNMKGVNSVVVNRKEKRVTVTGYVEDKKVIKKVESTGKKAEKWPYIPYNLVSQPYAVQAYDKKAPPGYVRNVEFMNTSSQVPRQEDQLTHLFSDDNPNACSIM